MDFSTQLINWYEQNKRDLPWRHTNDPYKIWLSEIILQQTRVQQGLPYYEKFLENFPTVQAFAEADIDKILHLWQGLGYYSRARNMHKAANEVMEQWGGEFPNNYKDLLTLKGVGKYTAAAIASFAFKEKVATVDGNVYRVLSRVFGINEDIASGKGQKVFSEVANDLISETTPDIFNQALMEMGAIQCVPKSPKCEPCPFVQQCLARENDSIGSLPVKLKKVKVTDHYYQYLVVEHKGKFVMKKREGKGIWNGLYDFPLIHNSEQVNALDKEQLREQTSLVFSFPIHYQKSESHKHILSHQRLYIDFYHIILEDEIELSNGQFDYKWYDIDTIKAIGKPIIIENYLSKYIY
ncbi:A/G-specific adenine glycosylase [Flammeovirga sp. EKP202]|uniref:A/G-specific adenine glycosylase n=1 Tax=Flammeovirga sp. EKP202 TaxID=2770592 RepID=UPI00165EC565|nr:A/G-specific adenine glycosylase [Flammeovirga sp. EKP202]MBD0404796.1 A/G-specific adenine glycosylase [Flammeovirga sp. EKP202]